MLSSYALPPRLFIAYNLPENRARMSFRQASYNLACMRAARTVITGTGSHIPAVVVPNEHFLRHEFLGPDQKPIGKANDEILRQFESITGIRERRYVSDDLVTSDIAADAAQKAIAAAGIEGE